MGQGRGLSRRPGPPPAAPSGTQHRRRPAGRVQDLAGRCGCVLGACPNQGGATAHGGGMAGATRARPAASMLEAAHLGLLLSTASGASMVPSLLTVCLPSIGPQAQLWGWPDCASLAAFLARNPATARSLELSTADTDLEVASKSSAAAVVVLPRQQGTSQKVSGQQPTDAGAEAAAQGSADVASPMQVSGNPTGEEVALGTAGAQSSEERAGGGAGGSGQWRGSQVKGKAKDGPASDSQVGYLLPLLDALPPRWVVGW